MHDKGLRTSLTTGGYALPLAAVMAAALWAVFSDGVEASWGGAAVAAATVYLLVELNNRNALLRVRSRMISTTYLWLLAACPFLFEWSAATLPAAAVAASFFPLFAAYQNPRAAAAIFHVGLLLSLASLVWHPLLLLLPFVMLCLGGPLRALSLRTLSALLLGALVPYWFAAGWLWYTGQIEAYAASFAAAFRFAPADYAAVPLNLVATAGVVALLALAAILHFVRTAYNDKIRTRMLFYSFIIIETALLAALALVPSRADVLLRLLLVATAPLVGHHLTLGRGRLVTVWFYACLVLLAALCVFNVLMLYGVAL